MNTINPAAVFRTDISTAVAHEAEIGALMLKLAKGTGAGKLPVSQDDSKTASKVNRKTGLTTKLRAALRKGPVHCREFAAAHGVSSKMVVSCVGGLKNSGCEISREYPNGKSQGAVYTLVRSRTKAPNPQSAKGRSAMRQDRIVSMLSVRAMTRPEITEALGICPRQARYTIDRVVRSGRIRAVGGEGTKSSPFVYRAREVSA
ncbi:hypothetical protein Q4543_17675 [Salipiger sp. 1_MG-2023]|uniref:hypothetical protein n=1 Tax=Salipiger sp. 1_MG-2023 TaxID=3062665 RepID=UPI0026E325F6|nr:hypothetical protein [Salipiger sp. 1_MG-2023]MDO6587345.1 hypothetical protein [Salipiger sp. 1_MG-2023]